MQVNSFIFVNRERLCDYKDWDCIQMAGELLEWLGFDNPYKSYAEDYSTELGAYRVAKRNFGDLGDVISAGFKEVRTGGIIGLVDDPKPACVLITGRNSAVGLADRGWRYLPIIKIKRRFDICRLS